MSTRPVGLASGQRAAATASVMIVVVSSGTVKYSEDAVIQIEPANTWMTPTPPDAAK